MLGFELLTFRSAAKWPFTLKYTIYFNEHHLRNIFQIITKPFISIVDSVSNEANIILRNCVRNIFQIITKPIISIVDSVSNQAFLRNVLVLSQNLTISFSEQFVESTFVTTFFFEIELSF